MDEYDFKDHEVTDRASLVLELFNEKVMNARKSKLTPSCSNWPGLQPTL